MTLTYNLYLCTRKAKAQIPGIKGRQIQWGMTSVPAMTLMAPLCGTGEKEHINLLLNQCCIDYYSLSVSVESRRLMSHKVPSFIFHATSENN